MTLRNRAKEYSRRDLLGFSRGRLKTVDDTKQAQLVGVAVFAEEEATEVEYAQAYGFFAVPLEGAEVTVAYQGNNRSAPVVTGVQDRRHRPTGHAPGDAGIHDNREQIVELVEDAINIASPAKIVLTAPVVVINSPDIRLGGEDGGRPASGVGDIDDAGHALVTGSPNVKVT